MNSVSLVVIILLGVGSPILSLAFNLGVIYTNDIHGAVGRNPATFLDSRYPPMLGGGPSFLSFVNKVRQEFDYPLLLIDQGDFFYGDLIGGETNGYAVLEFFNQAGYDLVTLGNHDFDKSYNILKELAKDASFPFLSANLIDISTGKNPDWVKSHVVLDYQGVNIAIIGITLKATESLVAPENYSGYQFKSEITVLQPLVDSLKANGIDIIIVSAHMGMLPNPELNYEKLSDKESEPWYLTTVELAKRVSGIDVIFGGHIHVGFANPYIDPVNHTMVFQNWARLSSAGMVELEIDSVAKVMTGYRIPAENSGLTTLLEDEWIPEAELYAYMDSVDVALLERFGEVIGESTALLLGGQGETTLGNFVMDAFRYRVNGDFAFTNIGGLRANLPQGNIKMGDIRAVLPFDGVLVSIEMTGKQLKEMVESRVTGSHRGLQISGAKILVDRSRSDMDRIKSFEINGAPINPDSIYRVVTSDYIAQGNIGFDVFLTIPQERFHWYDLQLYQVVADYLREQSPYTPIIDGRWKEINP